MSFEEGLKVSSRIQLFSSKIQIRNSDGHRCKAWNDLIRLHVSGHSSGHGIGQRWAKGHRAPRKARWTPSITSESLLPGTLISSVHVCFGEVSHRTPLVEKHTIFLVMMEWMIWQWTQRLPLQMLWSVQILGPYNYLCEAKPIHDMVSSCHFFIILVPSSLYHKSPCDEALDHQSQVSHCFQPGIKSKVGQYPCTEVVRQTLPDKHQNIYM